MVCLSAKFPAPATLLSLIHPTHPLLVLARSNCSIDLSQLPQIYDSKGTMKLTQFLSQREKLSHTQTGLISTCQFGLFLLTRQAVGSHSRFIPNVRSFQISVSIPSSLRLCQIHSSLPSLYHLCSTSQSVDNYFHRGLQNR